ncbi:TPA: hypothetical protein LC430_004633 [Salmonella enterica subsp. enterica serovar Duisburg]|nr:hypothetical protein [Salmonella enterica subsp. enterica serovar Duisburg]
MKVANSFNPVLQVWINYYGKLYKSKLTQIREGLRVKFP